MRYEKPLKKALRQIKRYAASQGGEALDWYEGIYRESRPLAAEPASFSAFSQTGEFDALCQKLKAMLPDGKLPEQQALENAWDGFLSVSQAEHFRNTVLFCLVLRAAEAAAQEQKEVLRQVVQSFFILKDYHFPSLTERLCRVSQIFSAEKANLFAVMQPQTKQVYLHAAALQAKKQGISEEGYAAEIVRQADAAGQHCGFFLPLRKERKKEGIALLLLSYLLAAGICFAFGILLHNGIAGVLLYLPVLDMILLLMRMTASLRRKPAPIFRMEVSYAQQQSKVAIAVSSMLPKASELAKTEAHLRTLYLANRGTVSVVCLLADLPPGSEPETPSDQTDIEAAVKMIDRLNGQFGGKFVIGLRERSFSQTEQAYIGRERKRGAVLALTEYMTTGKHTFRILHGDCQALLQAEYAMLLDADTEIPFETLSDALAAAVHPLNRPQLDSLTDTVKQGYGIFAPSAAPSVRSFSSTCFSRDMCRSGGIAAYDRTANDFYGDYFSDGIFCGKGLVHAELFYKTMNGRFRPERMLSHDIAEGLVLRVLPLTDMTLTDDFPKNETAYLKREHRWIRGDMQNLPLLCARVWFFGRKTRTPFGFDGRYKLFDNLRRAITPIAALVGILGAIFVPERVGAVVAAICLLSAAFGDLVSGLSSILRGGFRALSGLYKEDALPEALSAFLRAFLSICRLAVEGLNALDAVVRSIWRMTISKKHLLSWTTAAAADQMGGLYAVVLPRIPVLVIALLLAIFGGSVLRLAALFFVFDLFYAWFSQRPLRAAAPVISGKDREYLLSECAGMWRYFLDTFQPKYHYLPPDNVSISPLPETAERTSPTNIGLALCVTLAARDFGFIDSHELYERLDLTLTTVEKLEKWHGNLMNWYDIRSLQPLAPGYVSFVDSGNFICCITALREGLYDYMSEEPRLGALAVRLGKLCDGCDLSVFYNKNRKLFSIGYNCQTEKFSSSYYDLLMSEARMASYIAVANGQVERAHWASLARTTAKCGRYSGALSWSGTMFEYFMPYLFLPSGKNTLSSESLWFCVKSQMRYAQKNHIPWGISESCFYAFNEQMQYHYRANGVPQTALKRFDGQDLTVAPYATFLTLPFVPEESVQNLHRLEKYPIKGKYGFFEALDFTPSRTTAGQPSPVRCFMVHHLGMSLLAAENALHGMVWQKRLMRNLRASAAAGLLEEKIPADSFYYDAPVKEKPEPEKEKRRGKLPQDLPAAVYAGGELSGAMHQSGCMALTFQGFQLLRKTASVSGAPGGIFAAVRSESGLWPFTFAPCEDKTSHYTCRYRKNEAEYRSRSAAFELTQTVQFHAELSCMRVCFTIRNLTAAPRDGALLLYMEPSLTRKNEETAHRTYSKLFIQSQYAADCLTFSRRQENAECALAVGLLDSSYTYTTDPEEIFPAGGGMGSLFAKNPALNNRAGAADGCFFAKTSFRVGAKKELRFTLLLAAGKTPREARQQWICAQNRAFLPAGRLFAASPGRDAIASSLLCDSLFALRPYRRNQIFAEQNRGGIPQLWAAGISGDDALFVFDCGAEDSAAAQDFAAVSAALNAHGFRNDLAILYAQHSSDPPQAQKAWQRFLQKQQGQGGVHLLARGSLAADTEHILYALAQAVYPKNQPDTPVEPIPLLAAPAYNPRGDKNGDTPEGFLVITQPPVPWCRTLANRNFGCLVSNRSLGFTWAMNAAENKLTPWTNDPYADTAGEILSAEVGGKHWDLTANAAAVLGDARAQWKSHAENLVFTAAVSVPEKGLRKKLCVHVKNTGSAVCSGTLYYTLCPVMGRDLTYSRTIVWRRHQNGALFSNPYQTDFQGYMYLRGSGATYLPSLPYRKTLSLSDGVSAAIPFTLAPGAEWEAQYSLSYGLSEKAAVVLADAALPAQKPYAPVIQTDDALLQTFANRYLVHQTMRTRVFARCAFYQCGGAYGFRDQLQDCMNLVKIQPNLLKEQLYRSAAAQFPEGDVLHWWHMVLPGSRQQKRGVRTRCSDDMLWLPYAAAVYIKETADAAILDVREADRYFSPRQSEEKATLYEHAKRALRRACQKGTHGLLKIGAGDWNDSYSAVGEKGEGESVWLTMFYIMTAKAFLPLCRQRGDGETAGMLEQLIKDLTDAVETAAWDGEWYLRAFYDDGTPMGAKGNKTCQIDLLPQTFAVLADLPDRQRRRTALKSAWQLLYDRANRMLRLFWPPFTPESKRTGYVNFYPPGVRENGGQYTHAAVWFLKALWQEGFLQEAEELLRALNPMTRLQENGLTGDYRNEPYALSGDIYALNGYEGRGGWSLYTGAAGWLLSTLREMYPPSNEEADEQKQLLESQ